MVEQLTDNVFWDQQWSNVRLPVEVREADSTPYIREILNIFKLYLSKDNNMNILEIGGAPGGYLAYLARNFRYNVSAIDYSEVGCKKILENFKILNMPLTVYNIDIIHDNLSQVPLFDLVYSLGLIEHFSEPLTIIEKHINLIKPNGLLLLGVPCFLGINKIFFKILKPDVLYWHNLSTMDIGNWKIYEEKFGLSTIFKGYLGGWEPRIYMNTSNSFLGKIKNRAIEIIAQNLDRFSVVRKLNSKWWSCYAVAIYRKM